MTSILPDNSTALERALEHAVATALARKQSVFPNLWNPNTVPTHLLPWLAEAMGVLEWDSAAPQAEQRATLANVWQQYRHGGQRRGINKAIEPLGFNAELRPWHTTAGTPYSLLAVCWSHDRALTSSILNRLQARIAIAKSERDTVQVIMGRELNNELFIGATMAVSKILTSAAGD
jgi:phage tail P2-like protein